jgi:isoamylase
MSEEDWQDPIVKVLGLLHCDDAGGCLLILSNAFHEPFDFKLPGPPHPAEWRTVMRTTSGSWPIAEVHGAKTAVHLPSRSLIVLAGKMV